ncbi:ABC transporter, ATP-binding protein [Lacticaseibacillus pantheris DSM 15945 = JCM 12539 = NBRC 106106]|jgi:ABC-2 type transport system ATP-binding protein|uniref:ABC transporter, ATP-binding protein n=1 Tax=Lacticaseibacillus pantheris DSM 15945 = JCM 12539 = NBRC 106106 TaxID=1423783 RepID=A0A0R1UAP6_9LACO|nr:ATP-binding cassette domain-containing protein [Lacticaseibacillus pantheris]KRL88179.1 ABC transporter, ATP-binding protein [Lacticaseibacillus pantheris DSM 15945 = JCM 12539 = NBRC 106106]
MAAILTVDGLHKSFGSHQVLRKVSFTVEPGHVVGLVGPNGAGKSTIMKIILGLIPYDRGQVTIGGQSVGITSHQALGQVGALIEYPGIYPFLTGKQHLQLFAQGPDKQKRVDAVVHDMGMEKYINSKAKRYSLGMKQKLGVAQALLNEPALVILDEPMNGLDPAAVKSLRDLIRAKADAGTSFLISSHILSELEKVADDVLILNKGLIVEQTSMTAMVNRGAEVYLIRTSDDQVTKQALGNASIPIMESPQGVLVNHEDLNDVLRVLVMSNIHVDDIAHVQHDLESSFLDMVNAGKGGARDANAH